MKIDQSICNDWTLSPLKNCLNACGLKIKIASEQSVSVALCAGVCATYLHLLFVCFCVFEHRCVVFFCVLRAHACFVVHGHCLYPGAVLLVRSQVFINLDSGRQITRPQAATHPSFQGLPKTAFNTHYSFPCCYKPNFQLLSIGFASRAAGLRQREALGVVMFAELRVSSEVQLCSLWVSAFPSCHFEWHRPLCTVLTFPVVRCLPPQVGFACVCLHTCARLSVCLRVLVVKGIGGKTVFRRFVQAEFAVQ